MEIKNLETRAESNKGREMQVIGWDGKETDFYITVAGIDSDIWQKTKREMARKSFKNEEISDAESMAAVTIGWRGLVDNGKEVPFSYDVAVRIYREAPYLGDQVLLFMADRENFMKPLKKG